MGPRVRAVAIGLGVLAACSAATPAQAVCVAAVRHDGRTLLGASVREPLALGAPLRGGTIPPCVDALPAPDPPPRSTPVRLSRIRGVPPRVAVAFRDQPRSLFLGVGFPTVLAAHPLHRALFQAGGPRYTDSARCARPVRLRGRLPRTAGNDFELRLPGGDTRTIVLEQRSRVLGLARAGVPHLHEGDRVEVVARRCPTPQGRLLVALRVRRT